MSQLNHDRSRPSPKKKDIVHSREYCRKFAYKMFMDSIPWNIKAEGVFRIKNHIAARLIEKPEFTDESNKVYVAANEHLNQFLMSNLLSKAMKELNVVYESEREGVIDAFSEIVGVMTKTLRKIEANHV